MNRVLLISVLCLVVVGAALGQTLPVPTNLVAQQVNEGAITVKLTWDASANNLGFRVYRSIADTSHFQPIGMANSRTFFDRMVVPGTRYFYVVKSVVGNQESGPSNIAEILVVPPPPPTPPPTPTGLRATLIPGGPSVNGVAVKLVWNGPRGPWSFRVSRSANDTTHYMNIGTTQDTQFVDHGVHPGTAYNYYVKAFTQHGGESGRSNVVNILVIAPPRVQGTIRGTVIDDSTNAPIRGVSIQFFRTSNAWNCSPPVFTDSLGRYSALLDTGRYIIRANAMNWGTIHHYRPEYFDNCPEPSCATVVAVAESSVFVANFGLSRPTPPTFVYVSGSVKDTNNNPLRHARVSVIRTIQEMNFLASLGMVPGIGEEAVNLEGVGHTRGVVWNGYTDSLGNYRARVIANQSYIAMASKETFLPEYYNNKQTVETADVILVAHDTTGIDFSLAPRPIPNNSISGSVKDSAGTGVPSRIVLFPVRRGTPHPNAGRYGHTDSLGNFTLTGLEAGQYFVLALPFSHFAPSFYKANNCGVIRIQDADTVNVSGNVTGIDICVNGVRNDGLTLVRGTIRSTAAGVIAGVRVVALDAQGGVVGIGITNAAGAYELNAVLPGAVSIVADRDGFASAEMSVTVNANVFSMENVNITMTPSTPTSVGEPGVVPQRFALDQNYPNPFNPSTTISYALSSPSIVTLKVFNVLGQEVATLVNGTVAAGTYDVVWNGKDNVGRNASSGVYMYKLHAVAGTTEFTQIKKMILLK